MSGVFGWSIKNSELSKIGLKNELIGLILCLVCGELNENN